MRLRAWLVIWAGWTALALLLAVSTSLTYRSTGRPANWSLNIGRALAEWWLWALLTPAVVGLARRFPLQGRHWRRHLALHLAAGVMVAGAKTAADRAVFAFISGFWLYWLASTFALQLVVYAAVVAAAHGLEYYRRSREREQLEARLADARLRLLSVQLQPHFLFNTLNTIAELVHEDPEAADRMITGLSDLLRHTLKLGATQEIPLSAELELLSKYLDIQRARFGSRLQVTIAVADDVREAGVPMMLLQPLVENAIRHGLARHREAGRIDIEARRADGALLVEITDDGPGAGSEAVREGIGLGNARARLQALYGSACRLELANVAGRGARVSVTIPMGGRGAEGPS